MRTITRRIDGVAQIMTRRKLVRTTTRRKDNFQMKLWRCVSEQWKRCSEETMESKEALDGQFWYLEFLEMINCVISLCLVRPSRLQFGYESVWSSGCPCNNLDPLVKEPFCESGICCSIWLCRLKQALDKLEMIRMIILMGRNQP